MTGGAPTTEARSEAAVWFVRPRRTEETLRAYGSNARAIDDRTGSVTPNRAEARCSVHSEQR